MAYLKNENGEIIVDAVLTKYGRNKLSQQGNLGVTKFSLSDDEIDYALYNTSNPDGQQYYDVAIRELPVLEALPGDTVALKYHLFTDTNNQTSTISTLSAIYPAEFNTGISRFGAEYIITPVLTPLPSETDIPNIYYVAEMNSQAIGAISGNRRTSIPPISLSGIGTSNEILATRQQLKNMSATTTTYAVGTTFKLVVNSMPQYKRVFTIKITTYGPINTNSYSFNFTVSGYFNTLAV